ncbi:MAG: hypothetical protein V9F00_00760 [Nocardioides sp.]
MGAAAATTVVEQLDEQVRVAVRREGIDPQRDAQVVRRIAEDVVREHDERSLTGSVQPVGDAAALVSELTARVAGFGALQPYLEDDSIEEIWINEPSRVFIAKAGRHQLTNLVLTQAQVTELVERMLKSSGRRIDVSQPFVDAMLPEGHRLHVVLEGISRDFSAVKTAMPKTTARFWWHAAAARFAPSARDLRED